MKERMRKALGFLGLIEDEYGEYGSGTPRPFTESDVVEEPTPPANGGRPAPTTANPVRPLAPRPSPSAAPSAPLRPATGNRIRTLAPQADEEVAMFFPADYNESRRITDILRSNRPVVLNVTDLDPDVSRRVVDFTSGTIYALNAKIERLHPGVYLICPHGTHVGPDAKSRLRASNFRSLGDA